MTIDLRIAITLGLAACGGAPRSVTPPVKPAAIASAERAPVQATGPNLVLGWYCPDAAAGRPAVTPVLAKTPEWTDDLAVLGRAVSSREVKQFAVFNYEGGTSGTFSVAGAAISGGVNLAIGSYHGAEPCDVVDSLGTVIDRDASCESTTRGCALAIGMLEASSGFQSRPYEEDPEAAVLMAGAACEIGENLVLDVDGDGTGERFSIRELLAGRAPVELPLQDEGGRTCEGNFAAPSGGEAGGEASLLRVGVLDLDEDGRPEVLYRLGQELLVFGAPNSPARMELVGRAALTSAPK